MGILAFKLKNDITPVIVFSVNETSDDTYISRVDYFDVIFWLKFDSLSDFRLPFNSIHICLPKGRCKFTKLKMARKRSMALRNASNVEGQ